MSTLPAVQSLSPARWCLAGQVVLSPHSLKLIRKIDNLSPKLKAAIATKTLVPVILIETPLGQATLLNAKIESVGPVSPGSHIAAHIHTNELEEFDLVFQKIEYTNLNGGKTTTDTWNAS